MFRDIWGRRWCHLVAMDAICFRDRAVQYEMAYINHELIKAYTSFRPRKTKVRAESLFGIVTGNWGCGVFNGDKQLKGIN
jgi:poly(ADP-ribose) glycohydrolase